MNEEEQKRVAVEGAKEVLEFTIRGIESRVRQVEAQLEDHQQTVFMVFDAADMPPKQAAISDSGGEVFLQMSAAKAREYLVLRQLRSEREIKRERKMLASLKNELKQLDEI